MKIETKNLYHRVREFINNIPVGETFQTKDLLNFCEGYESVTKWKECNNNRFYRTHTYKGYLRRGKFLTNVKKGTWRVDSHIPDWFSLGMLEVLIGYDYSRFSGGYLKDRPKYDLESIKSHLKVFRSNVVPVLKKETLLECRGSFKDCFKPLNECICDSNKFPSKPTNSPVNELEHLIMTMPYELVKEMFDRRDSIEDQLTREEIIVNNIMSPCNDYLSRKISFKDCISYIRNEIYHNCDE